MARAVEAVGPAGKPRKRLPGRARTLARSEQRTAWWMLSPTVLVILFIAFIPVLDTIWLSLHNSSVIHTGTFTKLSNYTTIFGDPTFRKALVNTVIFTFVSVAIELVIGLGVALVLHSRFRGRAFLRATVLIPWAFPVAVSGVVFRLMLQDQVGILSYLAHWIGLAHGPILSNPSSLMISVIIVDVWASTPFMALLILAGLQTIPREVIEAAAVDGARPLQRFMRITLPLLKPALLVALLFRTLQAWSVYDLFWVLAQRQINSLSTYVYESVRLSELNFAPGTAAATFIFISSFAIAILFIKGFGTQTVQEA